MSRRSCLAMRRVSPLRSMRVHLHLSGVLLRNLRLLLRLQLPRLSRL